MADQDDPGKEEDYSGNKGSGFLGSKTVEHTTQSPEQPAAPGQDNHNAYWQKIKVSFDKLTPGEKSAAVLGVIGSLIALILGTATLRVMNRQNDLVQKQNDLMSGQTELMDRQSKAMNRQTELMDRQLTETREASRQADEQNRQSFGASIAQSRAALNASIAASRLDQRPWLVVQSCRLSAEPKPGVAITAECDIVNTGKTPAIDVYVQHDLRGVDGVPPSVTRQRVEFVVPKVHASRSLSAPGARPQTFTTPPYELNEAAVMQYSGRRATIFINAIIRYRDTFGIPHWTTYCAYHLIGQGLAQVLFCSGGNATDHNQAVNDSVGPPESEK